MSLTQDRLNSSEQLRSSSTEPELSPERSDSIHFKITPNNRQQVLEATFLDSTVLTEEFAPYLELCK